jgi:DNA polymerase IV
VSEPILHVDMDAFYASVEVLKNPSLRGSAVIVGGGGGRGVVTSASYEARALGVTSAMPIVTARRLCPHGVYVANDFDAYTELSSRIRDVFTSFTPLVEPLSLDEAFLDVSGSARLFGAPVDIARAIKRRVADLGLPCTVGVAPNKFLAKVASARAKPDGLLLVAGERVEDFLHPLPVTALWGVGPHTAAALERLGLKTVGELAQVSRRTLERAVGTGLGAHLYGLARGVDERPVSPYEAPKSVGCENTFDHDLDARDAILREVLRLADRAAARLRAKTLCGRTVILKVRYSNFKTITRSRTLAEEVDSAPEIYAAARDMYARLDSDKARIRLLGVSVTGLAPGPPRRQMDLLSRQPSTSEASAAVDAIRARWGSGAVTSATLLDARE